MKKTAFVQDWTFLRPGEDAIPVTLPHDAQLSEKRSPDAPSGSGCAYFAGGSYVYEKTFEGGDFAGKTAVLQFEGVYRKATVFLNGQPVGSHAYGYAPFFVDLTGRLLAGRNTLRVTVDNSQVPNSRWYSGAGIFRPVWLWMGEKDHILPEGVSITTLSFDPARILVKTEITGDGEVSVEILDEGTLVARGTGEKIELTIPKANLWSAESPHLYTCRAALRKNGVVADTCEVPFGIRKVDFSPKGLFVNGKEVLLKGGCLHHDNGILGACSYPEAEERKVRTLKNWGFNAVRSAHNPASPSLLEACDRLGMYVMDEMWDMWYKSKTAYDYALDFAANWKGDVEAAVRRDFNHPSVLLYSIGNEVTEPAEEKGVETAGEIVRELHRLDPSRPVTAGLNLSLVMMAKMNIGGSEGQKKKPVSSTDFNREMAENSKQMVAVSGMPEVDALCSPVLDLLDIAGYNYGSGRYPLDGTEHPNRVIVGSETFPQDLAENWAMVEKYPYLTGDFLWTAWDYLGEVGLGAWVYEEGDSTFEKSYPWLLAEAGVLDILGDDTAEAGMARAIFEKRKTPYIGVRPVNHPGIMPAIAMWRGTNAIPSWSFRSCEGNEAAVEVYTAAKEAELFLNGRSLGRKPVEKYLAAFALPYEPGELTAVSYEDGQEAGRCSLQSATGEIGIRIMPESPLKADKLTYIRVDLAGENGVVESNADQELSLTVTGGRLLGFGSACPKTERSYLEGCFPTHYGKALGVVIPESDTVTVEVSSASGLYAQASFEVTKER